MTSSLGDNVVDHVVCLKVEFLSHTTISNKNGDFYAIMIYPYLNRSVCLLMGSPTWWRFSFCLSGSSLVLWWRDTPLVREFQMWGHRCKQWVSRWFQGHTISLESVQQLFDWAPPPCRLKHLTYSWHCLWPRITVDSLWHWNETGKAFDWCQMNFSGKYLWWKLANVFFCLD